MKNNYDFIINFKTIDDEQLSQEAIYHLIGEAQLLFNELEEKYNLKGLKVVIAQAVESARLL